MQFDQQSRRNRRRFQRRRWGLVAIYTAAAALNGVSCNRQMWRRRHENPLWRNDMPNFNDQEWRKHLRMSRETFEYIAEELRPFLEKTRMHS